MGAHTIKMENKYKLGWRIVIILLALIMFIMPITFATPVPLGIDGRVFRLDGLTQVRAGIPVKIINLETNDVIEFKTGRGTSGRYSVSLPWSKGTEIEVTAYNPVNSVSRNTSLSGVIHKFDLMLNMTLPQLAPNITSEPALNATQHEEYKYDVNAIDWNEDILEYYLELAPEGMDINNESGLITWMPNSTQSGNYEVVVRASDNYTYDEQSFTIFVEEVNDAPTFNSLPALSVVAGTQYFYKVDIFEPEGDSYTLNITSGPNGMSINSNNITWITTSSNVGVHLVDLLATDSQGNKAHQIFNISVSASPPQNSGSGGSRTSVTIPGSLSISSASNSQENTIGLNANSDNSKTTSYSVTAKNNFDFKNAKLNVDEIVIPNNFDELTLTLKEPERIYGEFANLNRFVFRYFDVTSSSTTNDNLNGQIIFTVNEKWLRDRSIRPEEIVMMQFVENSEKKSGEWVEIKTKLLENIKEEGLLRYSADFSELSLFAIAHNFDSVPRIPLPNVVDIKQSFIVYGNLLRNNKYFKQNFNRDLIIRNENTGQEKEIEYFSLPTGYRGYQGQLQGEFGETIKIIDAKSGRVYAEFILESNRIPYNLEIGSKISNSFTGYVSLDSAILESNGIWYFIILAFIIICGFYSVRIKKIIDINKKYKNKPKK